MAVDENLTDVLLKLKRWTPLRDCGVPVTPVAPPLFRASEELYIVARRLDRQLLENAPDAPFVWSVLWAPSDGSARRAVLGEVEADDGAVSQPPSALLPQDMSYAMAVKDALKIFGHRVHESDAYAGAPPHPFVNKVLEAGPWSLFFRTEKVRPDTNPYAVSFRLPEG